MAVVRHPATGDVIGADPNSSPRRRRRAMKSARRWPSKAAPGVGITSVPGPAPLSTAGGRLRPNLEQLYRLRAENGRRSHETRAQLSRFRDFFRYLRGWRWRGARW